MSITKEDIREMWGLMHDDFKSKRTQQNKNRRDRIHETCDSSWCCSSQCPVCVLMERNVEIYMCVSLNTHTYIRMTTHWKIYMCP